jgi:hypothetical protein
MYHLCVSPVCDILSALGTRPLIAVRYRGVLTIGTATAGLGQRKP